jgi:AhpD family alkylhydroperoxidase
MSHVDIGKEHPAAYRAMLDLTARAAAAARDAGLAPGLVELLKIRASQINGCAYCLRMHVVDATALGETPERLAVLAAWWESQYFTVEEQAALQIVEQVTNIQRPAWQMDRGAVPDGVLAEDQIAAITWVAIAINTANRVAISSHFRVGP